MRTITNEDSLRKRSVLACLRALDGGRTSAKDALLVAELQANLLRKLTNRQTGKLDEAVIASLPRLLIERRPLPVSGVSHWDGENWRIYLNADEPAERQRFTLLHEYWHIVDHGGGRHVGREAERIADYFAGCALMPRRALLAAWRRGLHSSADLAQRFGTSERAVEVRLTQLGLLPNSQRGVWPRRGQRSTTSTHSPARSKP